MVIKELKDAGYFNNTLIVYTSDNGPPFPNGRTNLYDSGMAEPMMMSSPFHPKRKNKVTYSMSSHLDLLPTFLDWFNVTYEIETPDTKKYIKKNSVQIPKAFKLTGKSLLPLLDAEPPNTNDGAVFASQNFHEVTMNFPMRAIRTKRYKLIHNLNYRSQFPIDQDFYVSPTFQDILNRTLSHQSLPWFKTLGLYYNRVEWELFDLKKDPSEITNLANKKEFYEIRTDLEKRLKQWLVDTNDPWRCSPHAVLQDKGEYKDNAQCLTLGHDEF